MPMSDLALLIPELILATAALALTLAARRIRKKPLAVIVTVLAAVSAAAASGRLLPGGSRTGFDGMITVDAFSQFFKVLISATLAITALLSIRSLDDEGMPRAE